MRGWLSRSPWYNLAFRIEQRRGDGDLDVCGASSGWKKDSMVSTTDFSFHINILILRMWHAQQEVIEW